MKNINPKDYNKYAKNKAPKINYFRNCIWAFCVGGTICTFGQLILNGLIKAGVPEADGRTWLSIILIFIGALLTGLGVYDKIGKKAGAGSIVPITGFANSIVSPAMEFKREGYIFGVCAKMFVIAGPVLVYGFGSSVFVGLIYFLLIK